MYCLMIGHQCEYEVQTMIQVFYPNDSFIRVESVKENGITIVSVLTKNIVIAEVYEDGSLVNHAVLDVTDHYINTVKKAIKYSIYNLLKEKTKMPTPWGVLTGIRPTKIVHELWKRGFSDDYIRKHMSHDLDISNEKIDLSLAVARAEQKILSANADDLISLYIGIPFCVSKCLYCSFTSYSLKQYRSMVNDYLLAVKSEIQSVLPYLANKRIQTIYIGGGTPTSLDEAQLLFLLQTITESFNLQNMVEFTVEAGRPDTINEDKLKLLKQYNVNRISINPQTMNEDTLQKIGRNHTVNDFLEAFYTARKMGHSNINIDLIIGLPNETINSVYNTLCKIKELEPENLTIHTLAIKRASKLRNEIEQYNFLKINEVTETLNLVEHFCEEMGLNPYYLYRQKNMLGNFENVGYCRNGYECIYNIQIMEENQTIIAFGAGASTKTINTVTGRISRFINPKSPEEYIKKMKENHNE